MGSSRKESRTCLLALPVISGRAGAQPQIVIVLHRRLKVCVG